MSRKQEGSITTASGRPEDSVSAEDLKAHILAENQAFEKTWQTHTFKRMIADALVSMRLNAGLTQSELARKVGWKPSFVSRLENMPVKARLEGLPTLSTLIQYSEACGGELGLLFAVNRSSNSTEILGAASAAAEGFFHEHLCNCSNRAVIDAVPEKTAQKTDRKRTREQQADKTATVIRTEPVAAHRKTPGDAKKLAASS